MVTDCRNGEDIRADNHSFDVFLFELDAALIALLALKGRQWTLEAGRCQEHRKMRIINISQAYLILMIQFPITLTPSGAEA